MKEFLLEHKKKFILGIITIILAPFIVNYLSYKFIEIKKIREESKIEASKKFITDLEKIKLIAPNNSNLQECLINNKQFNENDRYEFCFSKIKQNENEARSLLDRNISSIRLFFGNKFFEDIQNDLNEIDYLLYEMGNNQLVLSIWHEDNCSDGIDFIPIKDIYTDKVPKDKDGKVKCSLMVQTTEQFLKRTMVTTTCNRDCVSATKSDFIKKDSLEDSAEMAIIPGTQTKLSTYFAELNSMLYSYMLGHIDNILQKLQTSINN